MKSYYSILAALLFMAFSCQNQEVEAEQESPEIVEISPVVHPDWVENASIYEVNIRQHTLEGTFKAFQEDLPRLKELGVKILWFMPVQPIGVENRKGELGSYYSIANYKGINPEFGTMEDFKTLVSTAHEMGFKVILDWVANHSSWDNVWMEDHPEWYTRDDSGNVVSPVPDWSDVADLNYENPEMRAAMTEAMKFWVTEADVDGFRCDVGMMVPMDYWVSNRKTLDAIKPMFWLVEAEGPKFHTEAFDMSYGWEFHHLMNQVAKGEEKVEVFDSYQAKMDTSYTSNDIRMFFTTNHDENSWNGTIQERMGENHLNFFVLAATFPNGMPLIYSGQEAGLNKRLAFFRKDTIDWSDTTLFSFYKDMIQLKSTHEALRNGEKQGKFQRIKELDAPGVYAYKRIAENGDEVFVALNFSGDDVGMKPDLLGGDDWTNAVHQGGFVFDGNGNFVIEAHNFLLMTSDK